MHIINSCVARPNVVRRGSLDRSAGCAVRLRWSRPRRCTRHPGQAGRWMPSCNCVIYVVAEPFPPSLPEPSMAETKLVVEHREHLWSLLIQAAQIEHLIMCQYLYASFSLKTSPDEGLTAEQADAVGRWHKVLTGIAIEEMLHLAL